jgi:hypothetical protein
MEVQRHWRSVFYEVGGGGSKLLCGGESGKPGGRFVSTASESSVGEVMLAVAVTAGSMGVDG